MKRYTILAVSIAVVLASLGGYFLWLRVSRTPEAFFRNGKQYYDQQKYAEASIEFLNAIKLDPRFRDAHYFLALSYIRQQNTIAAFKQLRSLLEYYPDDIDANLQLGAVELAGARTNADLLRQAKDAADKVLSREPQNVAGLVLAANVAGTLKDYDKSVEFLQKATEIDPKNIAARLSLGASFMFQKKFSEAEKTYLEARSIDPGDKSGMVAIANFYTATGNLPKAEAAWKDAFSAYVADKDVYLSLANFYALNHRLDDMDQVLRKAQLASADGFPLLTLANFYTGAGRRDDAMKLLLDLRNKFPDNLEVAARLAMLEIGEHQEHADKARIEIARIMKAQPQNAAGSVLLGELEFRTRHFDAAEAALSKEPAFSSRYPQVHFVLGQLALNKKDLSRAQDHFQKALAIQAAYLPAREALAEAFMDEGRPADAREEIRRIFALQPGNVAGRLVTAMLDMSDKNFAAAEPELTVLVKLQPKNPAIQHQLALCFAALGKRDDAEQAFQRAVELDPNSDLIFGNLVKFYLTGKQRDRAKQLLDRVPEAMRQAFHYELMGVVAADAANLQEAASDYKKAVDMDPNRASAELELLRLYEDNDRSDDAMKLLDAHLKRNPSDSRAYAVKGSLYEKQGKIEEAERNYSLALQGDPNMIDAANSLAYLLAEQGTDLGRALGYAQIARSRRPEDPNIADTLGWVYYKMGQNILARDSAQFAAARQPDNADFQYHLGMIYKANRQVGEAENALKMAAKNARHPQEQSAALAALKGMEHQ